VAYDEKLAERIRGVLDGRPGVSERKMFGGIAFMVGGNMACGIVRDELMARVGPDAYEDALAQPHARPMEFTGRPMKGMVYVGVAGIAKDSDLASWVERGAAYAASLPPKD
jgi:TfoX/Sxy family transcriptional regulator of competence genes